MSALSNESYLSSLEHLNLKPPDAADGAIAESLIDAAESAREGSIAKPLSEHLQHVFRRRQQRPVYRSSWAHLLEMCDMQIRDLDIERQGTLVENDADFELCSTVSDNS